MASPLPSHTNAFPESPSTAIIAHYPGAWPFLSALFQPWELTPVTKLQHPVPEILEPASLCIPTGYCASLFSVSISHFENEVFNFQFCDRRLI